MDWKKRRTLASGQVKRLASLGPSFVGSGFWFWGLGFRVFRIRACNMGLQLRFAACGGSGSVQEVSIHHLYIFTYVYFPVGTQAILLPLSLD